MLKKIIVPIIISAIAIAAGIMLWQHGEKKEEGPKTTGLPMKIPRNYWPGEYWIEIADKKGWFEEAGLKVEIIDTNPDYFASVKDMVAGKIDTNTFSLFDLINFNLKGADLVMVINTDNSFGSEAIVAKQEISSIRELKGKTIGVSKATYLEYILSILLDRKGLALHDLNIVDMLSEKALETFVSGVVDAVITWEPHVTRLMETGQGRKLFDTSQIPGISPNGVVFHRSFVEKRPEDVQAYVNVWYKTTEFIKEDPGEAFGIIAEIYNKTRGEALAFAQTDRILDLRDNVTAFSYGTGFESLHGTARRINNFMIKKEVTKEQLDSFAFLDAKFIRVIRRTK